MNIIIDGNVADISFENEKTLADVITGLDRWAFDSGFCLTRISVDGDSADGSIDRFFSREIDDVRTLTVETTPFPVFYGEALAELNDTLCSWQKAEAAGRTALEGKWRKTPAAAFLAEHDYFLSNVLDGEFSDDTVKTAMVMVRQRIEESSNPVAVFLGMEDSLNQETGRLLDLPLDLQTGNDKRAAETIERFSGFTQRMLRLFLLLKCVTIQKTEAADMVLLDEFNSALREFLSAYENKDMVLSGDLAEYEIAPRIRNIYTLLKTKLAAAGM
jgi:hypothetical protein